ncbi:MAG: hypothetical protein QXT72_02085 [Candidatus Micrarchaeia archaeon]
MENTKQARTKTFKPSSLRRAYIPKSSEKMRRLEHLRTRIA